MTDIAPTDNLLPIALWTAPNISGFPGVRHGFTHRVGGLSALPFGTLNLGLHVGDDSARVVENRRRAALALGFDGAQLVCAAQVHGAKVARVTRAEAGRGARELADALPDADALVTDSPGLLLALFFADCVPVFFVGVGADNQPVVGVAHAGWRGMVGGVLENTVQEMVTGFGVVPATLRAAVGPHIGAAHFEVGEDVACQFPVSVVSRPAERSGRPHVDLGHAARLRLEACGISPEGIHVTNACTVRDKTDYFSHRRDTGRTGRMAALIGMIE